MPKRARSGRTKGERTRGERTRAALLATLLVILSAGGARAQGFGRASDADLRVEWSASEDRHGRPVIGGYVYNQRSGAWATSVRLLVEGLDATGHVVGSTNGSVFGEVPTGPTSRSSRPPGPRATASRSSRFPGARTEQGEDRR